MKKIFLYSLMLGMSVLGLTACSDDAEMTDSRVTYYVNLDMQGEEFVQVPIGTPYTDAGCTATENGEDVTSKIVVDGLSDIDVNTAGLYTITYSALNKDGFPASVSRTVAVCDPSITTDISGSWTTQGGTQRVYGGATVTPFPDYTIRISKAAPGIFYVTDLFAGYYDQRAGYGSSYACRGYLQLLADGTLVCLSSSVAGWGDSLDDFEGSYDAATETLTWDEGYAGSMTFHIILNK
ncbi:MAG: DUF5012 domain-containing protein [Prevotella sp.]|nr:DUF5012 domain-containing protein [Prevotella sp.]